MKRKRFILLFTVLLLAAALLGCSKKPDGYWYAVNGAPYGYPDEIEFLDDKMCIVDGMSGMFQLSKDALMISSMGQIFTYRYSRLDKEFFTLDDGYGAVTYGSDLNSQFAPAVAVPAAEPATVAPAAEPAAVAPAAEPAVVAPAAEPAVVAPAAETPLFFATPEEAAKAFVTYVARNDFVSAINCFAYEKKAQYANFIASAERTGVYSSTSMAAPEYEPYYILNKIMFEEQAASSLRFFVFSFLRETDFGMPIPFSDDEDASALFMELAPSVLQALSLERLDYARPDLQDSEQHRANIEKQLKCWGGSDIRDYMALYKMNGSYYMGGFNLIQYDDGWQILNLTSLCGGTSARGEAWECDQSEYLSRLTIN